MYDIFLGVLTLALMVFCVCGSVLVLMLTISLCRDLW